MDILKSAENYSATRLPSSIHKGETQPSSGKFENGGQLKDKENDGEAVYACEFCNKTGFLTYNNLQYHMILHSAEEFYCCGICKRMFKNRTGLTLHMRKHKRAVEYKCEICDLEYRRKSALVSHVKRKHEAKIIEDDDAFKRIVEAFKCTQCQKKK